jgi:translocation and assembly module TamB
MEVEGRGLELEDRTFERVGGRLAMQDRAGEASVEIRRRAGERLLAQGDFDLDTSGGGQVRLEQARLELDTVVYAATGPARVAWDGSSVRVDGLEVRRAGEDPMRLTADGTLAWGGTSDFALDVDGLRLGRLTRLLQMPELELAGAVDLEVAVRGPAEEPSVESSLRWLQPRWQEVALDSLAGTVSYGNRTSQVDLSAWEGGGRVFAASGTVPVDLALDSAPVQVVDQPMDLRVEAEDLGAANVLGVLGFLEEVEGSVSGEFDIGGTLESPEPQGVFRLDGAAWTMEALGVRHRNVSGSLTLNPDRTVEVSLQGTAAGSVEVSGSVRLEPLTDPSLDLAIRFDGFQAVARADIEGRVSGDLSLGGSYREPLAQGTLRVDQGTLFLEEFARSSEVVDLSDPRILEVVDTTALATRPILAGVRNPFLQNLRVDVDLSVPRDTWLRSNDMNVEMGGELLVAYDRTNRDLVLVGELEALRGSYVVLGRTFEVEGGTVGFIGTPGINPTLDIQAEARLPQPEGEPIIVTATVEGNLTQPRVQLSSEESGYAESELVSYLIFGTPSANLLAGSGQTSWRQGQGFLGTLAFSGVTYFSGTLANRLGSALAREVGVDYLNVTQVGNLAAGSGLSGTRIEVGQYVSDDVFIVVVLSPTAEQGNRGPFSGARVEWSLNDPFTVEAFVEDRLLRSGIGGFNDLGFENWLVLGVFVFREWGY